MPPFFLELIFSLKRESLKVFSNISIKSYIPKKMHIVMFLISCAIYKSSIPEASHVRIT